MRFGEKHPIWGRWCQSRDGGESALSLLSHMVGLTGGGICTLGIVYFGAGLHLGNVADCIALCCIIVSLPVCFVYSIAVLTLDVLPGLYEWVFD